MLQHRLADIVAVELAPFARVRRRKRRPIGTVEQPFQQGGRLGAGAGSTLAGALLQDRVDFVPNGAVDDGIMLAGIAIALGRWLPATINLN